MDLARQVRATLELQQSFNNSESSPVLFDSGNSDNQSEPSFQSPDSDSNTALNTEQDTDQDQRNTDFDDNIQYGNQGIVYDDSELMVTYSRIGFKRLERFRLSDFHFCVTLELKNKGHKLLIISALSGIIAGIQAIFQELKERFSANPNRIMYITMVHDGLRPGIKIG